MINIIKTSIVALILFMAIVGCTSSTSHVVDGGNQVKLRSYQTQNYDNKKKIKIIRAVLATLQDLGFVIDKADGTMGIVSATKYADYSMQMSVFVRQKGDSVSVRANAQLNAKAIEERGPYQDFFTSLDKAIFLEENL